VAPTNAPPAQTAATLAASVFDVVTLFLAFPLHGAAPRSFEFKR
jgi:hypothetical protein